MRLQTHELERRLNLFSQVNRVATSFYNANPVHATMQPIDLNNEDVFKFLKDLQQSQIKYPFGGGICHGISWFRPRNTGSRFVDPGR